ncbi:PHD finger protein MALE MEIOCYTE DEATH 1-like protein [Corchorus capsularis]|uniref:PHD finger protein MALE MEIOCYTE DEATH 1-like protein n=1 Tax=Corchorus capsularis TaxID=210143 RepID=A0A1R3JJJ4_COCAP|nr:PHD finger protein MALE MEIOCYTE DEATH 1-like protein [Corchorus capsularis]
MYLSDALLFVSSRFHLVANEPYMRKVGEAWRILHQGEEAIFLLEEQLDDEGLLQQADHCQHCNTIGWGHHLVSRTDYRVLVLVEDKRDSDLVTRSELLDADSCIFHGVIHGDGYAHLIFVDAMHEKARDIMCSWHQLCHSLCVRQISVEDETNWKGMQLRLLHGVAFERGWFGRNTWNYSHPSPDSDVTPFLSNLCSVDINSTLEQLSQSQSEHYARIADIINYCRDEYQGDLLTLSDLFKFMLVTVGVAHDKESKTKSNLSKYTKRRVEKANALLIKILRENANGWMYRDDLRTAASAKNREKGDRIGDTGFLDAVLTQKVISSGGYAARRSTDQQNNDKLLFTIEQNPQGGAEQNQGGEQGGAEHNNTQRAEDVLFLYQHLVLADPLAEKVLERNTFIKTLKHGITPHADGSLAELFYQVEGWEDASQGILEVARSAKGVQLKEVIQKGLRNTFCALANLVVTDLKPAYLNDENSLEKNPLEEGNLVTTPVVVSGTGYIVQKTCFECQAHIGSDNQGYCFHCLQKVEQQPGAPEESEESASLLVEGPSPAWYPEPESQLLSKDKEHH